MNPSQELESAGPWVFPALDKGSPVNYNEKNKKGGMVVETCFLSIVVPVYNAARYLAETLDSLLDQDISDYEILCINDGSTDASPEILEDYSRRYGSIRVIHQKNAGVSTARNVGIDNARGKFLWFVDADDLIAPNILGKCKAIVEETGCQRLAFGGYSFEDVLPQAQWQNRESLPCNAPGENCVVWRTWFHVDFLREQVLYFRHPDITHGEDQLFMFEVIRTHPRTVTIPDIVYFYRVHSGSAENGRSLPNRRKRLKSHIRVVEELNRYYRQDGTTESADLLMSILWHVLYQIASMPKADADPALEKLKQMGLYPIQRLPEADVRKSYLVDDSGAVGKVLEFFCSHIHRPWAYGVLRTLHQVKNKIRGI